MAADPTVGSVPERTESLIRVLVVDDHPLLRQGLRNLINAFDEFSIVGEAEDGAQAYELAQQVQPDVIMMDVHMPNMNGIEATRRIKTALPHVIIIGLSVNTSAAMADQMDAAGASAHLGKEMDPDSLYKAIHSALAK